MAARIDRRDFFKSTLALAGSYFATAYVPGAILPVAAAAETKGRYRFPHGLASGDPRPDAVVLWTRVEAADGSTAPIDTTLEVSTTPDFNEIALRRNFAATPDTDHTIRVVLDGLEPDTIYYYRFRAGADVTPLLGRTRTAPSPDNDREIRFAFFSCQHYEEGFYGAWQRIVNDDENAPESRQIEFVLNLGDFIYEYRNEGTGEAIPGHPLIDRHGNRREVPLFPGDPKSGERYSNAQTLDDYRHLYKTYLTDPALQAARARWPFIATWDDHEFSNDSWQSVATYTNEGTASQQRKVAANQAWFEYIPAMLSLSGGGQENPARDFVYVDVETKPGTENYETEPNNLAALASMTIYRNLRYGKHLDIIVSDLRSYRSDHPVPEPLADMFERGRTLLPADLVKVCDAGNSYNNGNPPDAITIGSAEIPNPRKNTAPGTVLGDAQKEWWKRTMTESDATWKCWATSVPLLPLRIDFDDLDPNQPNIITSTDAWDGYPGERRELMQYLKANEIQNVVALSGDHHMHFAGQVMDDFDAEDQTPVATEFSTGAISSTSVFKVFENFKDLPDALRAIAYRTDPDGGENAKLNLFNLSLLHGTKASMVAQKMSTFVNPIGVRNPKQNRHLKFIDSDATGFSIATVTKDAIDVKMIAVESPLVDAGPDGPAVTYKANFKVPHANKGETPTLHGPTFEGAPPFPFHWS